MKIWQQCTQNRLKIRKKTWMKLKYSTQNTKEIVTTRK